jgi:phospholipid transport system substrate-binding protein
MTRLAPIYPSGLARLARPVAFLVATLAMTLALTGTARAADGPGTKVVRKANDTIAALLKKKAAPGSAEEQKLAAQVTTSVRDFLDIDALGQRALVDHWAKLTPAQQQEFMGLLRSLIEDNYVKGLRANLDYQVVYTGESEKAGNLVVTTQIKTKRNNRPYTIGVDYVLISDAGKLRAFDVVTDGVGLVENYRAQFNKIIAKDGFDGLLAKMKKKKAAASSGS